MDITDKGVMSRIFKTLYGKKKFHKAEKEKMQAVIDGHLQKHERETLFLAFQPDAAGATVALDEVLMRLRILMANCDKILDVGNLTPDQLKCTKVHWAGEINEHVVMRSTMQRDVIFPHAEADCDILDCKDLNLRQLFIDLYGKVASSEEQKRFKKIVAGVIRDELPFKSRIVLRLAYGKQFLIADELPLCVLGLMNLFEPSLQKVASKDVLNEANDEVIEPEEDTEVRKSFALDTMELILFMINQRYSSL